MSIVYVTKRPQYYAAQIETPEPELCTSTMTFKICVSGLKGFTNNQKQKNLLPIVEEAIGEKGRFVRDYASSGDSGYYDVGGCLVRGATIYTDRFTLDTIDPKLRLIEALRANGLSPGNDFQITYHPDTVGIQHVLNLQTIIEARRELIQQSLHLEEEMVVSVGYGLTLSFSLGVFSFTVVEAAACILQQASQMAAATGKARMKPCDMSNPKYQMRTWLLRLGFIGEQFERPRKTLLDGLDGDAAFFSDDQRKRAMMNRRAGKMNA